MLEPSDLVTQAIRPALKKTNLWCPGREALILGTGLAETNLSKISAGGIYGMSLTAHDELWSSPRLDPIVKDMVQNLYGHFDVDYILYHTLCVNLYYASAMAGLVYARIKHFPAMDEPLEMAEAWLEHWPSESEHKSGAVDFAHKYEEHVIDLLSPRLLRLKG
jgi:hypothetical protein